MTRPLTDEILDEWEEELADECDFDSMDDNDYE